jgi:uncharacterized membrane protein YdjX (TVP38/TMEM64 family)
MSPMNRLKTLGKKLSKHKKLARAMSITAVVLIFLLIIAHVQVFSIDVEAIIENLIDRDLDIISFPAAAAAFFIIALLKPVIMIIPVTLMYIAAGIIFPTGWAIVVIYGCMLTSLTVAYFNGKRLGEKKVKEALEKNKRIAELLEKRKDNLVYMCFLVRLLPFPKDLLSTFFGAIGVPFWKYMIMSVLGLTPVMIPNVLAGSSITNPLSYEFLVPFGISLFITLSIFILYQVLTRKKP